MLMRKLICRRNGDRYAGEYFGDKIHGFGVYHFANGHCYEGSWHEGQKQGYGMYTFRSGDTRCGEWDGGTLKFPLPPLTDAVLRAVQVFFFWTINFLANRLWQMLHLSHSDFSGSLNCCRLLEKQQKMPFTFGGWMNKWTRQFKLGIGPPPLLELLLLRLFKTGWMANFVIPMSEFSFYWKCRFINFTYLADVTPFEQKLIGGWECCRGFFYHTL